MKVWKSFPVICVSVIRRGKRIYIYINQLCNTTFLNVTPILNMLPQLICWILLLRLLLLVVLKYSTMCIWWCVMTHHTKSIMTVRRIMLHPLTISMYVYFPLDSLCFFSSTARASSFVLQLVGRATPFMEHIWLTTFSASSIRFWTANHRTLSGIKLMNKT